MMINSAIMKKTLFHLLLTLALNTSLTVYAQEIKAEKLPEFVHAEIIPKPPQDASFRMSERFMVKACILLMVVPLKTYATKSMICSDIPAGLV